MIMVVTFQQEYREKISGFLSEKGYEVCVPPHRQDVLPMAKEKNPAVMVLDMYVAEPSELQVIKDLRTQNFKGKIVLLAGTSVSHVMPQALNLGVEQVVGGPQGIGGPMHCEQVEAAIRCALHRAIAARAYELYETRGRGHGKALEDWLPAEREIFMKSSSQPASNHIQTTTQPAKHSQKTPKAKKSSS